MKAIVLAVALLFIPAVSFAHSGTVFRSVINYVPLAVALVPLFWKPFAQLFANLRDFIIRLGKK